MWVNEWRPLLVPSPRARRRTPVTAWHPTTGGSPAALRERTDAEATQRAPDQRRRTAAGPARRLVTRLHWASRGRRWVAPPNSLCDPSPARTTDPAAPVLQRGARSTTSAEPARTGQNGQQVVPIPSGGVVALGRDGRARAREVPRSDGDGEFGERRSEAQLCRNVGGELVVAAAEVLHEGLAGSESCRRAEAFQPARRPQPGPSAGRDRLRPPCCCTAR